MSRAFSRASVRALALAFGLVASLAASSTARADCLADSECKGGRLCRGGQCTAPTCSRDTDCPGELICQSGMCGQSSSSSSNVAPAPAPAPNAAPPPPPAGNGTAQALSGMEQMVLDCQTASDDPRCKGQKGIVLSSTFVLPTPARTGFQLILGGGYNHGSFSGGNVFSGGMDIGASVYHGLNGAIPGPQGGWFTALVVEPQVGIYGGAMIADGTLGTTLASGALFVRPQLDFGIEFDNLGGFDIEDRDQDGIGFHFAYGLGAQYTYLAGDINDDGLDFGHGPVFKLMFVKYKPMERELVRSYIRLQLFFVEDITFITFGGGAAFP